MMIGNLAPLVYVLEQAWLSDLMLSLMLLAQIFFGYYLRRLQGQMTNWIIIVVLVALTFISVVICMIASPQECNYALNAVGYAGYAVVALVTTAMILTLRQKTIYNYLEAPVWLVTLGSLF